MFVLLLMKCNAQVYERRLLFVVFKYYAPVCFFRANISTAVDYVEEKSGDHLRLA